MRAICQSPLPRWQLVPNSEFRILLRHILGCASSLTFLRSRFAHPSLILRSRFAPAKGKILFCEGDLPIAPTPHYCALPPLFWRGGTGVRIKVCGAFCEGDLPIAPTPHYCALPPLFWRGGTGVRIKKNILWGRFANRPYPALLRTAPLSFGEGERG